ncbi:MAG TPA: YibE/F family protein [Thermoleophilaceae bacterium]|jgi:uncharacterized membrane protein|nr:YibE/F family protein [Thermoleophilaceae bacterium]
MTRLFTGIAAALALATLVALVILWPGEVESQIAEGVTVESESGEVERVEEITCPGLVGQDCQIASVRIESGPESGKLVKIQLSGETGLDPDVDPGDGVQVVKQPEPPPGADPVAGTAYSISDFERGRPMLLLAGLFVLVVLVFARWRGALSLLGLAFSLALVLLFVVPSILDGNSPLAVAVTGALAIALVTIPLAHGGGAKSVSALLGTAASLMLTAGLAVLFTELTHLTGLATEEATFLGLGQADLSLQGLLLAGMVIGALGVLDDVTISQASTVLALRRANPDLPFGSLFGRALDVGRDHVSATVNTLVLAYVGAALPILLIFSAADLGLSEAANLEIVAKEIVATLVGSIGLVAAVPITTALAALLALNEDPARLGAEGHAH